MEFAQVLTCCVPAVKLVWNLRINVLCACCEISMEFAHGVLTCCVPAVKLVWNLRGIFTCARSMEFAI